MVAILSIPQAAVIHDVALRVIPTNVKGTERNAGPPGSSESQRLAFLMMRVSSFVVDFL